jgi:YHS domain-containing protein
MKINNRLILEFIDYQDKTSDNPLINFKIIVKGYTYYFEDGEVKLNTKEKPTKYLTTKKPATSMTENIITMDLETRGIDGYMWPYCVGIYDGTETKSFFFYQIMKIKKKWLMKAWNIYWKINMINSLFLFTIFHISIQYFY